MTPKALRISVGARSLLALFASGLLLVVLSTGWDLRETSQRRSAEADAELSAIPLLYAGPLAYSLRQRPQQPEALHGLLHHILTRHHLRRVELRTPEGEQFRALSDDDSEPGQSAEFSLADTGELIVQATALSRSGDVLVLEMGEPVRIKQLAEDMIMLAGRSVRSADNPDGEIEIVTIGPAEGEKLYEELFYDPASVTPTSHPKILRGSRANGSSFDVPARIADMRGRIEVRDEPALRQMLFDLP